jgi:MFS family permease
VTAQRSSPDWSVIVLLSCAQFVMVLDTTVMNVSLTQVASDIGATIPDLQLAITFYTLTMAAFMLTGGKLGDVFGRRRTFAIGCVVYGAGSLITALAPNLGVLLVGWSLIEGLGATLVIPAILALTAANYSGADRATAYGILGGIAAAGAAAGPLIGGYVTETWTWRVVFAGETVLLLVLLLFLRRIADAPPERRQRIDAASVALSASGLALVVFGILRSSEWGWIIAKGGPEIGGETIEPFGLSLVPFLVVTGAVLLTALVRRQERLLARGADALLNPALLKVAQLRAGLTMLSAQQLVLAGTFFTIPVYLQVVLGKDALETGIELLPATVAIVVCALGGARLSGRFSPRAISRAGMLLMTLGVLRSRSAPTRSASRSRWCASAPASACSPLSSAT